MRKVQIKLTLKDDVVFSERSASQGGHTSLDYVPGSTLLGWAASRLYAKLTLTDAWLLFHSGKVRFGNGLPVARNGLMALPMPLCWHFEKSTEWKNDSRIFPERIYNTIHSEPDMSLQLKQLRSGYVTADGLIHKPAKSLSMKTAINPETGRAANAQLFGYEALLAGQTFMAILSADDDVPVDLFDKIQNVCSGLMHLGRSRSAQYGRVLAEIVNPESTSVEFRAKSKDFLFWLLSDMALERYGQPILKPEPSDMGLPKGELVAAKSFVRNRRYAPFNGKRKAPDLERQVICAGSVLCFRLDDQVDPDCLPSSYGMFREGGLGEVLISPSLLSTPHPEFIPTVESEKGDVVKKPDYPLVHWLIKQAVFASSNREILDRADILFAELRYLYQTASSLTAQSMVGPGKSQWGRIRELAMQETDPENLKTHLFGEDGVCKLKNNEDWTCTGQNRAGDFITFRVWLQGLFEEEPVDNLPQLLSTLAQRASEYMAQQKESV